MARPGCPRPERPARRWPSQRPAPGRAATRRPYRRERPTRKPPPRSAVRRQYVTSVPSPGVNVALGEVLLDQAALAWRGHRLAHDLGGGSESQIRDLGPQIRQGAVTFGGEVRGGLLVESAQLFARGGDIRVPEILGSLLSRGDQRLGLAPGFGDEAFALGRARVPLLAGLGGVRQPLLDTSLALAEDIRDRLEGEHPDQGQEEDEVEGSDDDPEEVDGEAGCLRRWGRRCCGGEKVHESRSVESDLLEQIGRASCRER